MNRGSKPPAAVSKPGQFRSPHPSTFYKWGTIAYRLEGRTLNRENPVSNPGRFEPLASLITPRCHSSLSCINEYLAIQTVVDMWTNSLRAAIAAWLNTSQRSWDGLGMNRSARGWSVKRFEQSYGPDTALYKNVPLLYFTLPGVYVRGSKRSNTGGKCVTCRGLKEWWCLSLTHQFPARERRRACCVDDIM